MILLGDAAQVLRDLKDDSIDLTITSPPYDNLRTYGGDPEFDFETIAKELYRVTRLGGVVVWIVNDGVFEGNESGSSFRQALRFKEIGFKLHDTMIYQKNGFSKPSSNRYHQTFDYMFIFCKQYLMTFNPIIDRQNRYYGTTIKHIFRQQDGTMESRGKYHRERYGKRFNIWTYDTGLGHGDITPEHPATFPIELAQDHIKSWSNEGDLILDPFAGSGTTLKAAHLLRRKWIGIEINPDYVSLIKKRLTPYVQQQRLDQFTNPLTY